MATLLVDLDTLMMDALDGTLSAEGWAMLREHLARRPEERLAFARLMRTDAALRAQPPALVSAHLAVRVMTAVRAVDVRRTLSAAQTMFIIMSGSILLAGAGLAAATALGPFTSSATTGGLPALLALGVQAMAFVRHLFEIASMLVRAVYSQPVAWALTLAMLVIVCAWTSVTASVWLPIRRHLRPA